jgi:excisionase family DNA binding protein
MIQAAIANAVASCVESLQYLTTTQVAEGCNLSLPAVHRLIRLGKLPAEKLGNGRRYGITEANLNDYLAKR